MPRESGLPIARAVVQCLFHGRFSCAFLVPATFRNDKRTPELSITANGFAKQQFERDDAPHSANAVTSSRPFRHSRNPMTAQRTSRASSLGSNE
jgi:hypothetical protein